MKKRKILTKKIAGQFLHNPDSVDLNHFVSMADGAAEVLAMHEGELSLLGLTGLSDASAGALAKHTGQLVLSSSVAGTVSAAKARLGMVEETEDVFFGDDSERSIHPVSRRLRDALVDGAIATAEALIDDLDLDQISEALFEQSVGDALGFLTSVVSDNLFSLKSPQFILCGKPRVVPLAEVAKKCGPIYGPFVTMSSGPRPAGWGTAAGENRILSWMDQGIGLVGDQMIDIADRYITARRLDEFDGALIAGPLESVEMLDLPEDKMVVMWKGSPVTIDPFDPLVFREIYSEAVRRSEQKHWVYDFRGNAVSADALNYFINLDDRDLNAEIFLALATIQSNEDSRDFIRRAVELDPSFRPWGDWIDAWIDFPNSMERIAELKNTDSLGPPLFTTCQLIVDLENGREISLDALESFVSLQYDPASPYLGHILAMAMRMCIEKILKDKGSIGGGGDPALYAQAIRLGYRTVNTIGWLMAAIQTGENQFVRLCLDSGFKPVGRFLNVYLNLLTTAAKSGNIDAVHAFLEHGANPDEPSHYGGSSTWALSQINAECGVYWPEEILEALATARNRKAGKGP
jgi:hypothetical protein